MIRKPSWKKGTLVALDPGSWKAGLAIFQDAKLVHAFAVINPNKTKGAQGWREMAKIAMLNVPDAVDVLVMEKMQFYTNPRQQKGPQEDIAELVGMAAMTAGGFSFRGHGPVELADPVPAAWKGQVPKEICHDRAMEALTAAEKQAIDLKPAVAKLDVLDAVALGLWALRRT